MEIEAVCRGLWGRAPAHELRKTMKTRGNHENLRMSMLRARGMVQDLTEISLLIVFRKFVFFRNAFAFVDEGNVATPRQDSGKKLRNDPLRESYFLAPIA